MTGAVPAQHETSLEEIMVTARPDSSRSIDHITQPVTILKGDNLAEKLAGTLGETLGLELGVSASDFGQGSSRPVIRGMAGPRVLIMQNGLGSMDVSTISVDHAVTLEPMNAEQIEVLRGPATLLFGSGASGGIVNISSNRIHERLQVPHAVTFNAGFNTAASARTAGISTDAAYNSFGLHLDLTYRDAGDYLAPAGEVINSGLTSRDINGGVSWIREDRGFFGIAWGHYQNRYEIPANPAAPDDQVFIDQAQDRIEIAGRIIDPITGIRSVRLRAGHVDYGHTEFEGPGEPGTVFSNDEWEARLELQHQTVAAWDGTFGIQYRQRRFSAQGEEAFVPATRLESVGLFMLEDTDWRNWHFELGARYEHQSALPENISGFPAATHNVWSMSAGALWHIDPVHALGLSLTRAQRAPAIEEMFSRGPHLSTFTYEQGVPDLGPETSHNLDLSIRREHDATNWTLNFFVNYINDYIYELEQDENGDGIADRVDEDRAPGGDLLLVSFVQNDAVFYGMEAEFLRSLIDNTEYSIDLRLWADWVRAKLAGGGDLPRIPPARVGIGVEFNRGRWHGDLDLARVFGQSETASLESGTDAYALLNVGVSYDIEQGPYSLMLSLHGTNLLDQTARRHTSFLKDWAPLPCRAAMLRLRLDI
jgi:iron complex outermembrane receptor protein